MERCSGFSQENFPAVTERRFEKEAVSCYLFKHMDALLTSIGAKGVPATSFDAHFRLVAIHPFMDGNGRAARLLMNLLLLRGGYPPVAVRPEDRKMYLDTLERASMREDLSPFQAFMHGRLDATLGDYLNAIEEAL